MDGLVPYSSSDDEEETKKPRICEKSTKNVVSQKLPCAISKLGAQTTSKDEELSRFTDPSLHNNRKRSFKHERGNWATYVYVSVNESILDGIPEQCQAELENIVDLQLCTDLHISLSKTVVLQYHWIDNFVRELEKISSSEMSFSVFLEQLEVYVNEEKTRTFLGFKVNSTKLMSLLYKVDMVMQNFNLPCFYNDPSFHVSFAWCLGDKLELLTKHFKRLMSVEKSLFSAINVNELHCKIGHKIYNFKLDKFS